MDTKKHSDPNFKEIGKLIKDFRLKKGMTNDEFREGLGVSYPTLSRVENGHHGPSAAMVQKLAAMGMDISDLSFASRPHSVEQTISYRLSEVENRLSRMEETIKKLISIIEEKE